MRHRGNFSAAVLPWNPDSGLVRSPEKRRPDVTPMRALGLVGRLGLVVIAPMVGGVFAGSFLDRVLGTGAALLVSGILIGLAAGLYSAYRIVMKEIE